MAVQSVNKALVLLDLLAFEDLAGAGLTLSDLAKRVGQPLNTTHSQLRSLVEAGYASQNDAGRYTAGPKCRQLGQWHRLQRPESLDTIETALDALGRRLSEGVVFVTLVDGQWVSVARCAPDQAIQVAPEAMRPDNIYTLATGRILTAYANPEQLARIVARHGQPGSRWSSARGAAGLERARVEIRKRGYELIRQKTTGVVMFACPVLDDENSLLGALGCYAPLFRCPDERFRALLGHVRKAAVELGRHLG
jgi:DNA-binding IclR family transcriptional regulator